MSSQDHWTTRPRDHTGTKGGGWVDSTMVKTTLLEHGQGEGALHSHHHYQSSSFLASFAAELKDLSGNTLLANAPSFGNESEKHLM